MSETAKIQILRDHDTGEAVAPRTVINALSGEGKKWNYLGFTEDNKLGLIEGTYPCNWNLLDNWYFKKAVNQRGETTYVGPTYSIDRWRSWSSSADHTITVSDAGLKYTAGQEIGNFVQIVEIDPDIGNNMLTFSFLANGELYVVSGRPIDSPAASFSFFSASIDVYFNHISVTINIQSGNSIDFIAAKLELGSEQTLAHKEGDMWVLNEIPDYATELAKCQRYQYIIRPSRNQCQTFGWWFSTIDNCANVVMAIPPMRVVPTITLSGTFRFLGSNIYWSASDPLHRQELFEPGCMVGTVELYDLVGSPIKVGMSGWIDTNGGDGYVIFDANL